MTIPRAMTKKSDSLNQFPFPFRGMPLAAGRAERRAIPRPKPAEEILADHDLRAPLEHPSLADRRVDQLSTTPYKVDSFVDGGVVLRWGKDLEIWRKVDVPRKGYAIAISDYEVEFVAVVRSGGETLPGDVFPLQA